MYTKDEKEWGSPGVYVDDFSCLFDSGAKER